MVKLRRMSAAFMEIVDDPQNRSVLSISDDFSRVLDVDRIHSKSGISTLATMRRGNVDVQIQRPIVSSRPAAERLTKALLPESIHVSHHARLLHL